MDPLMIAQLAKLDFGTPRPVDPIRPRRRRGGLVRSKVFYAHPSSNRR